jgi:nicotinamidase-related amidase
VKSKGDLFTVPELRKRFENGFDGRVYLVGQDGNACIKDSAKGAAKLGLKVTVLDKAVLANNITKWLAEKERLKLLGISFENS